jgi:hypothetical protein
MKKLLVITALLIAGFIHAEAQSSQQFEVQVAKEKYVLKKKLKVKFLELVEDSRCPIGTTCIWAGMAKIKINVRTSKGVSKDFELTTMGESESVKFEGYEIKLLDVNPKPADNVRIDRTKYNAKILVKKLKK